MTQLKSGSFFEIMAPFGNAAAAAFSKNLNFFFVKI
jgi:hypothetical protein